MTPCPTSGNNRRGFTLIELLVVMILALMLMFMAMMLFNNVFRGQEVRTAGRMVEQGFADGREWAAVTGRTHFMVMTNDATKMRGIITIYKDSNRNGSFDSGSDQVAPGGRYDLPTHCYFADGSVGAPSKMFPDFVTFTPTGYARFGGGYSGVNQAAFDTNFNGANPALMGDVVLIVKGKPHRYCLDVDTVAGKIRRQEYLFKQN